MTAFSGHTGNMLITAPQSLSGFGISFRLDLSAGLGRGAGALCHEAFEVAERWSLQGSYHPRDFNADALCDLAHRVGADYLVVPTVGPDGFRLFKSEFSHFSLADGPAHLDAVAALLKAAERVDLPCYLEHCLLNEMDNPPWREALASDALRPKWIASTGDQIKELAKRFSKVAGLILRTAGEPFAPEVKEALVQAWESSSASPVMWDSPLRYLGTTLKPGYFKNEHGAVDVRKLLSAQLTSGMRGTCLNLWLSPEGKLREEDQQGVEQLAAWWTGQAGLRDFFEAGDSIVLRETPTGLLCEGSESSFLITLVWPGSSLVLATDKPWKQVELIGSPVKLRPRIESGRIILHGLPETSPGNLAQVLRFS
jgi:hypothetical protein